MNLVEMHKWFRQYAQQMGMQNVRAILPEQIDTFINTSIDDSVNEIVRSNLAITNDRVITDNSKIGTINALRTLYEVKPLDVNTFKATLIVPISEFKNIFSVDAASVSIKINNDVFVAEYCTLYDTDTDAQIANECTSQFSSVGHLCQGDIYCQIVDSNFKFTIVPDGNWNISHDSNITLYLYNGGQDESYTTDAFEIEGNFLCLDGDEINSGKFTTKLPDCLFYGDLAINYKQSIGGYTRVGQITTFPQSQGAATQYYPVRIIEDIYLADALQDFILKPSLRSPIVVIHNNDTLDLYLGTPAGGISAIQRGVTGNPVKFKNNLSMFKLRLSYIRKPAKVEYNEDNLAANVECDMPEYMHVDILKHAVDLYRVAIQGSLMAAQSQARNQNQEIARNNARDEGYAPQS